jgi:hypothetical protein
VNRALGYSSVRESAGQRGRRSQVQILFAQLVVAVLFEASSNGRTSVFGTGYLGSSPSASALGNSSIGRALGSDPRGSRFKP